MKRFSTLITEIQMSSAVPLKWDEKNEAVFTVNGTLYQATANLGKESADIEFRAMVDGRWTAQLGETDPSNVTRVFATLMKFMDEIRIKYDLERISFYPYQDHEKRSRVYSKLAQKHAKQYGYEVEIAGKKVVLHHK